MKSSKNKPDIIEALESDYLYTGPSQIPDSGNGLFTAINIYKDEIIAVFKGQLLTDTHAKQRAELGHDQYYINLPSGKIMDSKHFVCFAKFANDASAYSNSIFKNNTKIALDDDGNVCLIATRNFNAGAELFCNYGKRYWKKHGRS